ncbi:unannotated protein [freshwater metagenome]|uniref:Unannotated protein n=1 Tax=freshwater metagenome TaxID=449393 RepID=A0A6J6UKA7_9ZZZZ
MTIASPGPMIAVCKNPKVIGEIGIGAPASIA